MLLAGSAALAQQGFIVEPWRPAEPRAAENTVAVAPVAPVSRRVMPSSGLPPVAVTRVAKVREAVPPPPTPWKPPIVALLVDPWAEPRRATRPVELSPGPLAADIVDPWAMKSRSVPPPRRQLVAPHSTIF